MQNLQHCSELDHNPTCRRTSKKGLSRADSMKCNNVQGQGTLFRFGGGRGRLHIHEGLGAADVAEGDLAQSFQLDIAHTV